MTWVITCDFERHLAATHNALTSSPSLPPCSPLLFAKFMPLASPLGDDGASQEANAEAEGHDNGHKRLKPNPLSEFVFISSSSSPLLLKQPMAQENLQLSPPSTLMKISWKEDRIDLGSIGLMAAEQLSKRPKIGGIYEAIRAHRESTVKRLRELCNKEPTIDVGIEMADVASLLKLMSFSTDETIESAGQKAHRGALFLLQAARGSNL